jgi:hypothetical protein
MTFTFNSVKKYAFVACTTSLTLAAGAGHAQTQAESALDVPTTTDANESPIPMPQDPDAEIDKAKPADEMLGETASTGTTLDVDPDSATVDGLPRDAESSFVNTDRDEAEVGIPDSENGILD